MINTATSDLPIEFYEKLGNFQSYVTSPEQISNDELKELRKYYMDEILRNSQENSTDEKTFSTPVYLGTVFAVQGEGSSNVCNWMWIVFSQETNINGLAPETTYFIAKLTNCKMETSTGELFIDPISLETIVDIDLNDEFFGLTACDESSTAYRLHIVE